MTQKMVLKEKRKIEELRKLVEATMKANRAKAKTKWTRIVEGYCPKCGGRLTIYIQRPNWARCFGECGASFDANFKRD